MLLRGDGWGIYKLLFKLYIAEVDGYCWAAEEDEEFSLGKLHGVGPCEMGMRTCQGGETAVVCRRRDRWFIRGQ